MLFKQLCFLFKIESSKFTLNTDEGDFTLKIFCAMFQSTTRSISWWSEIENQISHKLYVMQGTNTKDGVSSFSNFCRQKSICN